MLGKTNAWFIFLHSFVFFSFSSLSTFSPIILELFPQFFPSLSRGLGLSYFEPGPGEMDPLDPSEKPDSDQIVLITNLNTQDV